MQFYLPRKGNRLQLLAAFSNLLIGTTRGGSARLPRTPFKRSKRVNKRTKRPRWTCR